MKEFISETIMEKYEFRNIRPEETDQAIMLKRSVFHQMRRVQTRT